MTSKIVMLSIICILIGLLAYPKAEDIHKPLPVSDAKGIAVGFRVNGRIDRMFFTEHAEVKKGDILASLDKVPFEEALSYAKAQLQIAEAEYNKSLHMPVLNFAALEAARAVVETTQHNYDEAHAELLKRREHLVAGQLDNVYNDDVQNDREAQLNLERAKRELTQQENIADRNSDIDAKKAAVQLAEANVAIAQTNLSDTQLQAPSAGIIASRVSEVGANVPAGATIYTLSLISTVASNANVQIEPDF